LVVKTPKAQPIELKLRYFIHILRTCKMRIDIAMKLNICNETFFEAHTVCLLL